MTARPLRAPKTQPRLRVIRGRQPRAAVSLSPWLIFSVVVVVSMFSMVIVRTTLDRGAVELATLSRQIEAERANVEELELTMAGLQNATRIGPLAEEMGMVYPDDRQVLVVDGVVPDQAVVELPTEDQSLALEAQP